MAENDEGLVSQAFATNPFRGQGLRVFAAVLVRFDVVVRILRLVHVTPTVLVGLHVVVRVVTCLVRQLAELVALLVRQLASFPSVAACRGKSHT